jgi:hypothetical protein
MKVSTLSVGCLLLLGSLAGCKKDFGAGCEKPVDLSSPWSELGLPLEEGVSRVCSVSAEELKVRSYTWSDKAAATTAFEQALTASGHTKDRCSEQACYYDKDGFEVSVQPMDFEIKKKKLVTVALRRRADRGAGKKDDKEES